MRILLPVALNSIALKSKHIIEKHFQRNNGTTNCKKTIMDAPMKKLNRKVTKKCRAK
jgi:hypothetical protein